jgi:WD40 repeat protein
MQRVTLKDNNHVLICGLSNGDIILLSVGQNAHLTVVHTFKHAHDFGVNSIDALTDGNMILIASGGDDQ